MDKQLIRTRFTKSIRNYTESAQAQAIIASRLCCLLPSVLPHNPERVLEIGCGTGTFTRLFLERFYPQAMTLNDICPEVWPAVISAISSDFNCKDRKPVLKFAPGDAETCPLPDGQDLIVSCSVIQWFEDLEAFISRCHGLLREGGCLALTTFGPDNLQEVAAITGTGLSYLPMERINALLPEEHFRTVLAEEEHITLRFPSPEDVLRHLKNTGVTGIARTFWTRGRLAEFSASYRASYGDSDGKVPLTYHPIYIIAKRRR